MKNFLFVIYALISLVSCKSKVENKENWPKDISQKPNNNTAQEREKAELSKLIKEIESLAQTEICTDATDWEFSEIGSKPCGGPVSYIAYPIILEAEILPKIQNFTEKQSAFNKKYNLMSDCMLVMPPSGIKCVDGKAVLMSENSEASAQ